MKFIFNQDITHHFDRAIGKEWIETNGLGGWASSIIIGAISEIFDGAAPHEPRGAVAQAWSVAEILRALHEDILQTGKTL